MTAQKGPEFVGFWLGNVPGRSGTRLALQAASVMPGSRRQPQRYSCHWSHVERVTASGERTRTLVWICEYPYRTMRMDGPCSDCDGCPLVEARGEAFLARLTTDVVTH